MLSSIANSTADWITFVAAVVAGSTVAVLLPYFLWKVLVVPYHKSLVKQGVMSHLVALSRQDLPLATGLMLAADGETGLLRRTLGRMASFLSQGASVTQAIRTGYPSCPGIALSLIAAGERAGQLPAVLIHTQTLLEERQRRRQRIEPSIGLYALGVIAFALSLVAIVLVVVIPKYREILVDFETPMPSGMRCLIGVSDWLVDLAFPMLLIAFVTTIVITYMRLRPRRTPEPYRTSKLADWFRWRMPFLGAMQFSEAMAAMIPTLRYALRSGLDLPDAARLAATVDVNWFARQRMNRFADLLTDGRDIAQAATQAKLGEIAGTALAGGVRCGDMDAALRYVADYHSNFVSRWWIVLGNLAWPACTFGLALIIGSLVWILFQPLILVIDATGMG